MSWRHNTRIRYQVFNRINARIRHYVLAGFDLLAALALTALLAVVSASIITRLLFDLSAGRINLLFSGAIEIASYALLVAIFAALPRAVPAGLVKVDVLIGAESRRWSRWLDHFWLLVLAGFAGVLAWRYALYTLLSLRRGDATQDLQLPLYGFFGYVSVACAGLAVMALWVALSRESES